MKAGKGDIASYVLISGQELAELKRFDYPDSYGLGGRIERYKGTRPLKLQRWDVEYLIDTFSTTLNDKHYYPDKEHDAYKAALKLFQRLELLYAEILQDDKC